MTPLDDLVAQFVLGAFLALPVLALVLQPQPVLVEVHDTPPTVEEVHAMRRAGIQASGWKHDAIAAHMGISKSLFTRLFSGERIWGDVRHAACPWEVGQSITAQHAQWYGLAINIPAALRTMATGIEIGGPLVRIQLPDRERGPSVAAVSLGDDRTNQRTTDRRTA